MAVGRQNVGVFFHERVHKIQLIDRNVESLVLLGQIHIAVHFERVVKVSDMAKRLQKCHESRAIDSH